MAVRPCSGEGFIICCWVGGDCADIGPAQNKINEVDSINLNKQGDTLFNQGKYSEAYDKYNQAYSKYNSSQPNKQSTYKECLHGYLIQFRRFGCCCSLLLFDDCRFEILIF